MDYPGKGNVVSNSSLKEAGLAVFSWTELSVTLAVFSWTELSVTLAVFSWTELSVTPHHQGLELTLH